MNSGRGLHRAKRPFAADENEKHGKDRVVMSLKLLIWIRLFFNSPGALAGLRCSNRHADQGYAENDDQDHST